MANETMNAAQIHEFGGPEKLVIEAVPTPKPEAGQVLVRLKAAGVNSMDWIIGSGIAQKFMPVNLPWVPGVEGAGIVEAVGEGVTKFKPGQGVFGLIPHSYAEYALAPETELYPIPEQLSFEQIAGVPMGALNAWQAVIEEAGVQPGQRVLVHGGAGGVGSFGVQLAKWKGAHVIATTSTANVDFVRALGADQVIDYTTTKFEDVVKDVDVVFDASTARMDLVERSLSIIKPGGIFATVAAPMVDPEAGKAKGIKITKVRTADSVKLKEISELLASKKLVAETGKTFPLAQARQAQELGATGHGRGRIVLMIE